MDDPEQELRDAVFRYDIAALQEAFGKLPDPPADKRSIVDGYFKIKSILLLRETKNLNEDVSRLLDFCFEAASRECASKAIPMVTLTDIFEATTIDKCEKLFGYVEEKTPHWKSPGFIEACRTQLLRMCNDLLRRLSRTIDTEFCGRILIFLARCLPLTEKSGLNLTSQFNVDNVTKFDPVESDPEPGIVAASVSASVDDQSHPQKVTPVESMEVEEGETDVAGSSHVAVDYNLYVKFWQLQSFFAAPNTCYEKVGWRQFQRNANEILNAIQLLKLEPPSSSSTDFGSPAKRAKVGDEHGDDHLGRIDRRRPTWAGNMAFMSFSEEQQRSTYFAKYLTSQRLLHLQFNDSTFRRYILVQFLILFQYLASDVKFKDKKTHVLNDEQTRWIDESVKKCYDLLAETYPYGDHFVKVVQRILNREEHWNQWKNSGCDDFTQRTDKEKMLMFKKRQKPRAEDKKFDLCNPTLTQLWNVGPDNFEACKSVDRKFVPEVEPFLDEAIEQLDPEAGVEEKYKLINDENFQWRALRLLAMRSHHFYQTMTLSQPIGTFMSNVLEKIAEDIPKFKDLKVKRDKKAGETNGKAGNGQDQLHEQEIVKTDANADEEAEFRAQNFEGPGEQTVTQEQIDSLSALIGADWVKLAQEIEIPDDSIAALKKKQVPAQACGVLLSQWCDTEGSIATVKRLRNILLKAELFNEDVSAVLSTSPTGVSTASSNVETPRPYLGRRSVAEALPSDKEDGEEMEARPARVSSSVSISRKRSSNTGDGARATTPVMDERQSTSNA